MAQAAVRLIKSDEGRHDVPGAGTAGDAGDSRDARLAKAFWGIESDIADLSCMASLTADALEDLVGHDPSAATGDPELHRLPKGSVRVALFAINHLEEMAQALEARYRGSLKS